MLVSPREISSQNDFHSRIFLSTFPSSTLFLFPALRSYAYLVPTVAFIDALISPVCDIEDNARYTIQRANFITTSFFGRPPRSHTTCTCHPSFALCQTFRFHCRPGDPFSACFLFPLCHAALSFNILFQFKIAIFRAFFTPALFCPRLPNNCTVQRRVPTIPIFHPC